MQGDTYDAVVVIVKAEATRTRVDSDGGEWDDSLALEHPIGVPQREGSPPEFRVPSNPMEQVLERLHLARFAG